MGDEMYARPSGGEGTATPHRVFVSIYLAVLPEL